MSPPSRPPPAPYAVPCYLLLVAAALCNPLSAAASPLGPCPLPAYGPSSQEDEAALMEHPERLQWRARAAATEHEASALRSAWEPLMVSAELSWMPRGGDVSPLLRVMQRLPARGTREAAGQIRDIDGLRASQEEALITLGLLRTLRTTLLQREEALRLLALLDEELLLIEDLRRALATPLALGRSTFQAFQALELEALDVLDRQIALRASLSALDATLASLLGEAYTPRVGCLPPDDPLWREHLPPDTTPGEHPALALLALELDQYTARAHALDLSTRPAIGLMAGVGTAPQRSMGGVEPMIMVGVDLPITTRRQPLRAEQRALDASSEAALAALDALRRAFTAEPAALRATWAALGDQLTRIDEASLPALDAWVARQGAALELGDADIASTLQLLRARRALEERRLGIWFRRALLRAELLWWIGSTTEDIP